MVIVEDGFQIRLKIGLNLAHQKMDKSEEKSLMAFFA
jgi:hypothetical protein